MTAALEGVSGQQHAPAVLYSRERLGTHCTGGLVGPRASLDGGKSRPTGIRSPDRPACSSVAIPTELPGPRRWQDNIKMDIKYICMWLWLKWLIMEPSYRICVISGFPPRSIWKLRSSGSLRKQYCSLRSNPEELKSQLQAALSL